MERLPKQDPDYFPPIRRGNPDIHGGWLSWYAIVLLVAVGMAAVLAAVTIWIITKT